jgi:hypothetical protein
LLPNGLFVGLHRGAQSGINASGSVLLHSRQNVAVEIESNANFAMA